MPNKREIKLKIQSVTQTRQITKAMKLISAAKRKKARRQLDQALPYFNQIRQTMADILSRGETDGRYFDRRMDKERKTAGVFVLAGDKSLTGGYNHNIVSHAERLCSKLPNPVLFVAGQTGKNSFLKKNGAVDNSFCYPVSDPTIERAREMANRILAQFLSGELDEIDLVYTHMVNTFRLEPHTIRLLPLSRDSIQKEPGTEESESKGAGSLLCFEPAPGELFDALVPKYLSGILYGALVEAFTSEQSARMTAMDSATSNADRMIAALNLTYNRARQAAITQEITEIIGGASALD